MSDEATAEQTAESSSDTPRTDFFTTRPMLTGMGLIYTFILLSLLTAAASGSGTVGSFLGTAIGATVPTVLFAGFCKLCYLALWKAIDFVGGS